MNGSYAQFADRCPESDLPLLRELLAYDAKCPVSYPLVHLNNDVNEAWVPAEDHSPLHWSRQIEWPWILREGEFIHGESVLDVGGGWSVLRYAMASRSWNLVSIDNDPESVALAEQASAEQRIPYITHREADARDIPYPNNSFARVVCCSVLEHMPDNHIGAVKEAVRITKPGGIVLITMDVVVVGKATENYYVDIDKAGEILALLGLPMPGGKAVMGEVQPGVKVAVLMIRYVKP